MEDESLFPLPRVRVMQIITLAIIMGLATFMVVALFLVLNRPAGQAAATAPIITYVAAGLLLMSSSMAVMIPHFMIRAGLARLAVVPSTGDPIKDRKLAIDHLTMLRQSSHIVGLALIEGAGFTGAIAYLVEAQPLALGVAAAALVLLLIQFPTAQSLGTWMERQLGIVDEMRQRGGQE